MNNGLAHYFSPARTLKSRGSTSNSPHRIMSPRTDNKVRNVDVKKPANNFMISFEDEAILKHPRVLETESNVRQDTAFSSSPNKRRGVMDSIEETFKGLD